MVHRIPLVAAALAAAVFGAVAVVTPPVHAIGASATTGHPADATARGRYLIRTSGCNGSRLACGRSTWWPSSGQRQHLH